MWKGIAIGVVLRSLPWSWVARFGVVMIGKLPRAAFHLSSWLYE